MESQELFEKHFGRYITLNDKMIPFLEGRFEELEYASRELIVEGGTVPKYFYMVLSGVQMLYLISENGDKVVWVFHLMVMYPEFMMPLPCEIRRHFFWKH